MESQRFTTSELEKQYAFSGLTQLPSETSDWFGNFELLVPLKTSFTGTVAAGYKKTAFNNGIFTPDYVKESFDNGLYTYTQKDREELFTDFAFTWKYKLFAVTAGYRSNWMDVPVLENKHTISVDFTLQSSKGKWGTTLGTSYLLDAKDNKQYIEPLLKNTNVSINSNIPISLQKEIGELLANLLNSIIDSSEYSEEEINEYYEKDFYYPMDMQALYYKSINITFLRAASLHYLPKTIDLLKKLQVDHLLKAIYDFSDIDNAMHSYLSGRHCKTILHIGDAI